jgi:hypothetical protein
MIEETIQEIIDEFGKDIWLGFITLVITGFILSQIKDFITNLSNYFKARLSDIGKGQRIYHNNNIFVIDRILFKYIVAHDDKKTIYIPIVKYLNGVQEFPHPRYDDFDEEKYHEKPWNGETERRKKHI